MLLENDVFVDQFTGGKIGSPHVLDMISRVRVVHDTSMDEHGYEGTPVKITMRDGTVHETVGRVRSPRGEDPVTRDDVLSKFRKMTQRFWTESTQNRAIDLCDRLQTLEDTGELLSLLQIEHLPPMDMGGE
jgi:2-methylcitrate dehydratase PrpD